MTAIISMLRGVNVGGHNRISMDELRKLYTSLGLLEPQTYVQSGNVIFKTRERDLARLATRIENIIETTFGFRPGVILRTASELRAVIAANPFSTRRGIEPNRFHVMFLAREPQTDVREAVLGIKADPEELRMSGRELYLYYPNGMGRAKLQPALIERTLKTAGTCRNWNSVTKMLELAEKLESSR